MAKKKENTIKQGLSKEERYLLFLLRNSLINNLGMREEVREEIAKEIEEIAKEIEEVTEEVQREVTGEVAEKVLEKDLTSEEWKNLVLIAKKHSVLSLLYDELSSNKEISVELFQYVKNISIQTVLQNYKLLYLTNYVVKSLAPAGIVVVVLKGPSTAAFYPVPELRKSGDIDLLIAKNDDFELACKILTKIGFTPVEKNHANHHEAFQTNEGIMIELHTMLAKPFDSQKINEYLRNLALDYNENIREKDLIGSTLPVAEDGYHAFYLLLHMIQHYLRSGFGLKLLCDWVVFWNRDIFEKDVDKFLDMVKNCGLEGFAERITALCIKYLGLKEQNVLYLINQFTNYKKLTDEELEIFLIDIIEAEEFGRSSNDRMVMLRGTSILDYAREFHHQMRLNLPQISKVKILWPILWVYTLVIFLYNNKKIRKVSFFEVLKRAASRSENKEAMHLFK